MKMLVLDHLTCASPARRISLETQLQRAFGGPEYGLGGASLDLRTIQAEGQYIVELTLTSLAGEEYRAMSLRPSIADAVAVAIDAAKVGFFHGKSGADRSC